MRDEGCIGKRRKARAAAGASQGAADSGSGAVDPFAYAKSIGYSEREMRSVPAEAALTHGCGNPTALAQLEPGQIVLDLGCGGGLDVFLAARRVGPTGRVLGLDVAPELIEKASAGARQGGYTNVEFRVAEMERLPVAADSVDVVISNCVINHASDKPAVFREVQRVLRPGGRMFVSDLVLAGPLPGGTSARAGTLWASWLAVAAERQRYLDAIQEAGFRTVVVLAEGPFPMAEANDALRGRILSIQVKADK